MRAACRPAPAGFFNGCSLQLFYLPAGVFNLDVLVADFFMAAADFFMAASLYTAAFKASAGVKVTLGFSSLGSAEALALGSVTLL